MIRFVEIALLAALVGGTTRILSAPVPRNDRAGEEVKKLQGTWRGVFIDEEGKPDTSDVAEATLHIETVTFTLTYTIPIGVDEVAYLTYKGTFKLDPSRKPKTIDMKLTEAEGRQVDGKELLGIYDLENDSLRWCTSEVGRKDRPKKFATRQRHEHLLFRLEKEKP